MPSIPKLQYFSFQIWQREKPLWKNLTAIPQEALEIPGKPKQQKKHTWNIWKNKPHPCPQPTKVSIISLPSPFSYSTKSKNFPQARKILNRKKVNKKKRKNFDQNSSKFANKVKNLSSLKLHKNLRETIRRKKSYSHIYSEIHGNKSPWFQSHNCAPKTTDKHFRIQ